MISDTGVLILLCIRAAINTVFLKRFCKEKFDVRAKISLMQIALFCGLTFVLPRLFVVLLNVIAATKIIPASVWINIIDWFMSSELIVGGIMLLSFDYLAQKIATGMSKNPLSQKALLKLTIPVAIAASFSFLAQR